MQELNYKCGGSMRLCCIMSQSGCTVCSLEGFSVHLKIEAVRMLCTWAYDDTIFVPYNVFWERWLVCFFKSEIMDQYVLLKHAMSCFQPILWSEKKKGNWRYLNVFCLYRWLNWSYDPLECIFCITCWSLVSEQCLNSSESVCFLKYCIIAFFINKTG